MFLWEALQVFGVIRRMTANDDGVDPLEQGKKILGGLAIATIIVFVGPMILFPDNPDLGAGGSEKCATGQIPRTESGSLVCIIPGQTETQCTDASNIWTTVGGNSVCVTTPTTQQAGTGTATTNFMTKIEAQVEAGAKSFLEVLKWILLAATVGAVVILRIGRHVQSSTPNRLPTYS